MKGYEDNCPEIFKSLGYKCCNNCIEYYNDEFGKWGYNDEEWCGLSVFCYSLYDNLKDENFRDIENI